MEWPKNVKPPLYVRPASRVRYLGKDYIVKREIKGGIYQLMGRMTRKLPGMKEAIEAARNQKLVCQWGGYYSVYIRVESEEQPLILQYLWEMEKRRGVQPPDMKSLTLADEG